MNALANFSHDKTSAPSNMKLPRPTKAYGVSDGESLKDLLDALEEASRGKARVIIPQGEGVDWAAVAADTKQPITFVNRITAAARLCRQGQPAIAVTGISKGKLAKLLRKLGSRVIDKTSAH